MWLWDGIGALPRSDRWQTQARGSLRDDLLSALSELTENVLDSPERTVDRWWSANQRSVQRAMAQLTEIRRADRSTSPTCLSRCASCATWRSPPTAPS